MNREGTSIVYIKWPHLVPSTYSVLVVFDERKKVERNAFELVLEATYHPTVFGVGSFLRRSRTYA